MAGYICKIVIEDTHPPVWRRILIPDKITFGELHEIIQVLFGWEGEHLHEFQIPSDRITIGSEEESWGYYYNEKETLIDSFFRNYKWIRYTYDFGDDWRHKINIEKTDMDYRSRSAVLMKFKGDNFEEDCGGLWGMDEEARSVFDQKDVEKKLKHMAFPEHEELQETKLLKESMERLKDMFQQLLELKPEVLQSKLAQAVDDVYGEASPMAQKIEAWRNFEEKENVESLRLILSVKSQRELLLDLGEKEAADYYKYLRIPRTGILSREEQVNAISETLREHPEYLFYIFDENEYQELTEWLQYTPFSSIANKPRNKNMLIKALSMGFADFGSNGDCRELSFATDVDCFIGSVDAKTKKKTYRTLAEFDNRMGKLIQVYGLIELESLYEIYKTLYETDLDKQFFFRYIYWHARFNDFVNTIYHLDGTCYVASKELDVQSVFEKTEDYARELQYAVYSRREIEDMGEDLANRSEWVDILFTTLHYQLGMDVHEGQAWLIWVVSAIVNGETLNQIMEVLEGENREKWNLEVAAEVWTVISGLLLELELPMLKGRCRMQYAEEQKGSPWSVGMVSEQEDILNIKNRHMYQFPAEVQEWMFEAVNGGSDDRIKRLLEYKEQNNICSEEYFYLLAEACITLGQTKVAEKMILQLKNSSPAGKRAAKHLDKRLQERYEVVEDDWLETADWSWMEQENVQQPFVRNAPKIGRNEPCPCGSGKKYKKCCGRNC